MQMSYIYYGWGKWRLAPKGTLQDLCKIWYWRPSKKWVRPDTGLTQESFFTSQRRSLVKISSLARSSWFHSSRSFSCPFQLSLSCSLVLKAVGGQGKKATQQKKRVRTIPWPLVRQILSTFPSNQTFRTVILPTFLHIVYFTHSCPYSACPKAYNEDQLKP